MVAVQALDALSVEGSDVVEVKVMSYKRQHNIKACRRNSARGKKVRKTRVNGGWWWWR